MKQDALKLKDKLQEITRRYGQFHELLTLEQRCLVANDTRELGEVVKEKERIAEQIQASEEERIALVDRIAAALKANPRTIKLSDIAGCLEPQAAKELLQAKEALRAVLAQVKALNQINNELLGDSMGYVRSALEIVTGKRDLRQGYGMGGRIKTSVNVKRNLVNTRA
jgi:flagellar biosynthesis/type III secretory pathway chaperone